MRKLEVKNVTLSYGNQEILKDINFEINEGQITALIGPNGAGKSSAFKILAGLVNPDSGTVFLNEIKLNHFNELRNHCNYLLESADFYPYLTGRKNLDLFIKLSKSNVTADELLEKVGLLNAASKKVQHYSKGMKQRLGLAQALIDPASFLILDEPFNGLDPEVKEQILQLLIVLKNKGIGILVSTHLLEDIESIADDFILLNEGKIELNCSMESFINEKKNVKFYFEEQLPFHLNIETENCINGNVLALKASKKETKQILIKLCELGYIPYKIEHSSVLHDKYMEIIK